MEQHQIIFEKIKKLLSEHLRERLNVSGEGTHLVIDGSGIWIDSDECVLTIGHDMAHRHYYPEHDDLNEAIELFFNLLTRRKRITQYFKDNLLYKEKIEIELDNSEFEVLGITMSYLFPFWKRTHKKVLFEDPLIDQIKVEEEIKEIKNYLQHI